MNGVAEGQRGAGGMARTAAVLSALLALAAAAIAVRALHLALAERTALAALLGSAWRVLLAALCAAVFATAAATFVRVRAAVRGDRPRTGLRDARLGFASAMLALGYVLLALQPPRRLPIELVLGVGAGTFGLLALGFEGLGRVRPRLARWLDFTLFQLALAPLLLELALRLFVLVHPVPMLVTSDAGVERYIAAYSFTPGQERFGFPVNSRGFYDRELAPGPDDVVVSLIGDSFGVGIVPLPLHFSEVCERAVPHLVLDNLSVAAVGPPEYLHLLRTASLPHAPDAIVIGLFVGNDISFYDARARRPSHGLRRWLARESWLIGVASERWQRVSDERERIGGGEVAGVQGEHMLVGELIDTPEKAQGKFPWTADALVELGTMSPNAFSSLKTLIAKTICTPDRWAYQQLFPLLEELRAAAGSTPLYVLLLPDEFQVDEEVWQQVRAELPGLALDRDQPQRIIGAWLAERGIPCIDPLPALRALEPLADGKLHVYHLRDSHLNTRGNAVVGELLALTLAPFVSERRAARGAVRD